jgi:UDP-glucose 4-epimerase
VRDQTLLTQIFSTNAIDAVIHFAGLKAVGESFLLPGDYWDNNVVGTLRLCTAMRAANVRRLVFSSSAAVYGLPATVPVREDQPTAPMSPYGNTKRVVETMLQDLASEPGQSWSVACLRYFNPVGAHPSGKIGEFPSSVPSNLMPMICQVAAGERESLNVYGNDYPTKDGTGVRDFIHVVDLAQAHLSALDALKNSGVITVNLGTGQGYSVLEMLTTFERVTGQKVPYQIQPRRQGDVAASYADPSLAERLLGWKAKLDLSRMCQDAWRWQTGDLKRR